MKLEKGSFAAPLFFVSFALACAGSRFGTVTPWALSAIALAGAAWAGGGFRVTASWLSISAYSFAGLIALNTIFVSPAYTPAGLYHPLLLALAFAVFGEFDNRATIRSAGAALLLGAILAAWGLVQTGPLGVARAQALFETPATYASTINLLLAPLLATVILGQRARLLVAAGVLLSAALFAAGSRGGLLGLAVGLCAAAILAWRAGLIQRRAIITAGTLLAAGFLLTAALHAVPWGAAAKQVPPSAEERAASSQSRLELYALSRKTWLERPITGTGYLTFSYSLEEHRDRVPSYGKDAETSFVHDDYLQTLQELGPAGLAALLALTGLPLLLAYLRIPQLREEHRIPVIAAVAGLASMAGHALVDFPFYIPACLLLYGALLGVLDRQLRDERETESKPMGAGPALRAVRAGATLLVVLVLLRPLAAEASSAWGLRKFSQGDGPSAALWLGLAQRIEPANWRYHWYAGQFWDAQATDSGKREAARLSVAAYAKGVEANLLEPKCLLGLISVNVRHLALLDAPADPRLLQKWMARAEALAPYRAEVRAERTRIGAAK